MITTTTTPATARGEYELARDAARTAADELRAAAAQLERHAHRSTGPMYDGHFLMMDTTAAHTAVLAIAAIQQRLRAVIAAANHHAPTCGMPMLQEVVQ